MKNTIRYRFISVILCIILTLGLIACNRINQQPAEVEKPGKTKVLPNKKEKEEKVPELEVDSEQAAESLSMLRDGMEYDDQIAGAVAYLGYWEQGESMLMSEWLQENYIGLIEAMPFLLEIPAERILGAGYGELYCIVPRDENTSLSVNHVIWESNEKGVWPKSDEVLYREENAQPVLVFVNYEEWYDEPDTEIILVTNKGTEVQWCPQIDEYGYPVVPVGQDYLPMLMDFSIWGDITGLDYPEDWESEGSNFWWLPPTDWGLADTSWFCEHWIMDLHWDDHEPEYSGSVDIYYQPESGKEYEPAYSGAWRMQDDCLRLELSDGMGSAVNGTFPVFIDPSGECLRIQKEDETGVCLPFLEEDVFFVELTRTYG